MRIGQSWTCLLQLLLLVSACGVAGCASPTVSARSEALNVNLYCLAEPSGQSVTCEPGTRIAQFNAFVQQAMQRPHSTSTFTIWSIGPDRSASRPFFVACIPDHWGAPVSKSKGDFLRAAREGASGNRPGLSVPAGCHASGQSPPGKTQLVVFPDVSPLKPEVWQTLTSSSAPVPVHQSVICDRSTSTLACTPGAARLVLDHWITASLLRPGATFFVDMVARRDTGPIFQLTVPSDPLAERIAHVLGSRLELSRLISGQGETYTSTIIEAVNAAVRRLRERPGAYRLTVLSDMLQISPGGRFNFERALPAPKEFVSYLKKQHLTPDLRNISVMACGLPAGQSGPNSSARAARLEEIWRYVFQSMGADAKLFSQCDAAFAA